MDGWETAAGVAVAVATAAAAALAVAREWSARSGRRARIKQDIEIHDLLPKESPSKARLMAHIERAVDGLITEENEYRRDAFGTVLALVFIGGALSLGVRAGGAWWVLAVPLGLLGIVGLQRSAGKVRRDERGRPIAGTGERPPH